MKFQASRLCFGGVLPDPRISRMAPGHGRRCGCASTRPLLRVPIFGRRGAIGVLCFSLGSRLRVKGFKWRALFFSGFPPPRERRGSARERGSAVSPSP